MQTNIEIRPQATVLIATAGPVFEGVDIEYDEFSLPAGEGTVDAKVEGKHDLWGRKHDFVAGFNLSKSRQVYDRSLLATTPRAAQ